MIKKNIFSAIQPTGKLTVGHYIGVLNNWIINQDKYNCFYCIADLHSLTNINNKYKIKDNIYDLLAMILAIGIDPQKCIIFLQSSIIEHLQLYWLLNCYTYFGELNRMTQFKNKIKNNINVNCGWLNYPILMSSDILLYQSNYVPIGYDQIQHLELTRTIAKRINNIYFKNVFNIPEIMLSKSGSRIMSLLNIKKKMSKSDNNKNNVIYLLDSFKEIEFKIKNAITDSQNPPKIFFNMDNKPGISNLLNILSNINGISIDILEKKFLNFSYEKFKEEIIYKLNDFLKCIQRKYFFFRKKKWFLRRILSNGNSKARKYAKKNITYIYNNLNINYF